MTSPNSPPIEPAAEPPSSRTSTSARLGAFCHLPALLALSWETSRGLTAASIGLRLVRAVLPVATLYIAKLILDGVVALLPGLLALLVLALVPSFLDGLAFNRLGYRQAYVRTPERREAD